jgi:outer membrane protein OmpA-like peptidoglycan-associated protein
MKTLERRPTSALPASPRAATKRRLGVPSLEAHDVARTTGQPLDAATRAYMEPRFARDFSRVRVHADDAAGASARALGSHAYTAGEHVVFAPGRYRPDARGGRELLAHELTHVVQQSDAGATEPTVSGPGDASENAAARTATMVAAGGAAPPPAPVASPPAIQRTPDTDLTVPPPQLAPMFALAARGSTSIDAFDHDKAGLTADQQGLLAGHAGVLKELFDMDPTATVDVVGHADASGSREHNVPLSEQRAEEAKAALVAAGADPAKIAAKGVGESDLKVKTTAAHAANRRVEVRFRPSLRFSNLPGPAPWPSILPQLSTSQPSRAEPVLEAEAPPPPPPPTATGLPLGYVPSAPAPKPAPTRAPTAPAPRVMHPELLSPQPWFRQQQPKPGPKPWSFHDQLDADPALDYVPDVLHGPVVSLIEAFPGIVAGKAAGITPGSEKEAEASQAATGAAVTTLQGERYKQDVPPLFPPDTSAPLQLDKTTVQFKVPIDYNPAATRKQEQAEEREKRKREARRQLKDAQSKAQQEAAERRYAEIEAAKQAAAEKEKAEKEAAKREAARKK